MMALVRLLWGHYWVLDYNLTPEDCWPQTDDQPYLTCIYE